LRPDARKTIGPLLYQVLEETCSSGEETALLSPGVFLQATESFMVFSLAARHVFLSNKAIGYFPLDASYYSGFVGFAFSLEFRSGPSA
jgi:hypothetical protein